MAELPVPVQRTLQKLTRRVAVGLFLEMWPRGGVGSLLVSGTIALLCRIFLSSAAPFLPWLGLAPLLAAIPAIYLCIKRAYRPSEIAALAGSLSGGDRTP